MKRLLPFLALMLLLPAQAQTNNANLNTQLAEMKAYFLAKDYDNFANFTYPKVIEMIGDKSTMVKATRQAMTRMENEGFSFLDLNFKEASTFVKNEGELQCTLTQVMLMQTPQGKVRSESTLVGISNDNGAKWTFIDASGKDKAVMLKYFPNLHRDLVFKPKTQQLVD